jgi:hypothetical protein
MTLTPKLQAEITATHTTAKQLMQKMAETDHTPLYELDRRVKANPALLKEFVKDPAGFAKREVGFVGTEGCHLHFVDEKNEYTPKEGDAVSQLIAGKHGHPWSRVEFRTAIGPGCFMECGVCTVTVPPTK